MAHHKDPIFEIAGTKIKIVTGTRGHNAPGESQTINIYDHTDTEGNYRQVYRIPVAAGYISAVDIATAEIGTLDQLDHFLLEHGAIKEGARSLR